MAMQTQTTDQKIINSGANQYLIPFPAEGRRLLILREGKGLAASFADELGKGNDALPFALALRALRIEPLPMTGHVSLWAGPLEYRMPFPQEGRLFQVKAEGAVLEVTVADELGRSRDALPFTCAFRSLTVDPVLDPAFPFKAYDPGWVYRRALTTGSRPPSDTNP